MDAIVNFLQQTGFYIVQQNPLSLVMLAVSCVLLYLAIVKQFEPLLLLPIAFGMLLTNLPGAEMYHEVLFANGHVQWELFGGATVTQEIIDEIAAGGATQTILDELTGLLGSSISVGLLDVLYLGVKLGIYPLPDLHGRGRHDRLRSPDRQPQEPAAGRRRPAGHLRHLTSGATLPGLHRPGGLLHRHHRRRRRPHRHLRHQPRWPPHLLGPIAVAAYSYMALVPVIQPPIMKALTTEERAQDRDEAAAPGLQDGEDPLPHRRHHLRVLAGALRRASDRHA